jgi:hypothetical protein
MLHVLNVCRQLLVLFLRAELRAIGLLPGTLEVLDFSFARPKRIEICLFLLKLDDLGLGTSPRFNGVVAGCL